MEHKTYEANAGLGKTAQTLREFGERQNALNAKLIAEIGSLQTRNEVLAEHLGAAIDRIKDLESELAAIQKEQELTIQRFRKVALDLDKAEAEIDRLRLTAKLNTNAIDRLTKKDQE